MTAAAFIATGGGAGYLPVAPGTWGSALGLVLAAALLWVDPSGVLFALVAALGVAAGWRAVEGYLQVHGGEDPKEVVVDEIAGQWLALVPVVALAPENWRLWAAAFVLFRLFDIWKPWPVSAAERLPRAAGVMVDDLVAGALAAALVIGGIAADVL